MQGNNLNNQEIVECMFSISRLMKEQLSYTSPMIHLTMLQIQVLVFLRQKPGIPMSEVAKNFSLTLPAATSLINKLVKLRFVQRIKDKKDRRLVKILLTQNGEKTLTTAVEERKKRIGLIVASLSNKDKKELLRITKIIISTIEKKFKKNKYEK